MHLQVSFHKLPLMPSSSYLDLPKWVAKTKVLINPKNNEEQYFKLVVIGALFHKEIPEDPQHISKLKRYENQ